MDKIGGISISSMINGIILGRIYYLTTIDSN
jgi:hypothetical protein